MSIVFFVNQLFQPTCPLPRSLKTGHLTIFILRKYAWRKLYEFVNTEELPKIITLFFCQALLVCQKTILSGPQCIACQKPNHNKAKINWYDNISEIGPQVNWNSAKLAKGNIKSSPSKVLHQCELKQCKTGNRKHKIITK